MSLLFYQFDAQKAKHFFCARIPKKILSVEMSNLEQHELDDLAILTSGGRIFSPKSDFVFKNIFSNEEFVTGFLKAILDIPHEEYSKIEFSNTFLNKRRRDGKYSILDLVITTKSGHKIDVEIQRAKLSDFEKRVAYYASRLVSDQLDNNEQYDKLCRCIVIFILDHDFFVDQPERCFTKLRLRDEAGKDFTDIDIMEVDILELPKEKKNHAEGSLYDWADFFNAKTEDDLNKIAGKSKPINRAIFGLKKLSADDDFKSEYEFWLKNEREKYLYEKTGFLEGVSEGMAKGKIEDVISLVKKTNWPLEKAMYVLKIDDAYKDEIKAQLKNMNGNN